MAGAYQGFEIVRNLEENPVDINALNNLGGAPIADDISLFKNNARNTSSITVSNSNIDSVTDKITFTDRNVVFTNGTEVLFNNTYVYYVKNSNGENEFQLSSDANLTGTVQLTNAFSGTYTRSDEITLENISNYRKRRRPVATTSTEDSTSLTFEVFETDVSNNLDAIEQNLTKFKTVKNSAITKDKTFISDVNLVTVGHTLIADPDGMNNSNLTANSGPGLFIYNPTSNTKIRAFSDSQNVWAPNVGNTYLQTSARKITVGSLTVEANIVNIQQKTGTTPALVNTSVTAANITTAVFKNKIKVLINGEEYFLCLSDSASVP